MQQKYAIAFSSTNLVFEGALRIAGFATSFSSMFKLIFSNFRTPVVSLYLLFVSFKEGKI